MAVLITYKSDEGKIKNEVATISTTFSKSMRHSRERNYHANSTNRAKIELVQDFMSVPIICKFDDDPNQKKMKSLSYRQHFPHYMSNRHWMVSNSHANSLIWPKIETVWFYGRPHYLQFWWRFNQKWNLYRQHNIFLSLLGPQGQVTLMPTDETGTKSNCRRFYTVHVICKF